MIDQKSNKKIKIILISILIIACILIIISTIFAVFNSMNDKILRGIYIQWINVLQLKKEDTERKFKEIIDNPTIENKIKFKKECINRIEEDIKLNGDGWGIKNRQIDMIKEDIKRLENEETIKK